MPESARLRYGVSRETGEKARYPLVTVRNVYVFPGIPSLMERAFDMLGEVRGTLFTLEGLNINISQECVTVRERLQNVRQAKSIKRLNLANYWT